MNIAVFNAGVVHAKLRTISFSPYFKKVYYIDISGIDQPSDFLNTNIQYVDPFPDRVLKFGDFKLQRLINQIKPDGIVCHFASGIGLFNSILYGKCPVAAIAMGHDVLYDKGDGKIPGYQKYLIRSSLRECDYISAKSIVIRQRLIEYGVKAPISINYWGTDINALSLDYKHSAREFLGLLQNDQILLCPRAVEPRLNINLLVEAFHDVKDEFPNLKLIIIGRSLKEYRQKIEQYIQMNNLSSQVSIRDECMPHLLRYFYNASDAVISVAKSDGFPNCILEAMAYKKPVIVGAIEQVRELLINKKNSRLCEIDRGNIAEAIRDVFNHLEYYKNNVVSEAFDTVLNFGDIKKNGALFANEFIEIIKTKNLQKKINIKES